MYGRFGGYPCIAPADPGKPDRNNILENQLSALRSAGGDIKNVRIVRIAHREIPAVGIVAVYPGNGCADTFQPKVDFLYRFFGQSLNPFIASLEEDCCGNLPVDLK